jgi:soluble lytic murein transglycosylase-like protein
MMWDTEIETCAQRFSLPAKLIHAIIQVESSGNPWAIRFEPAFKKLYLDGRAWKVFGPISHDTELVARATSFGLMQVMGQVARERGFEGVFLTELCKPMTGIEYGCRQLKHLEQRFLDTHGWNGVIAAYNAGSPRRDVSGEFVNQSYVNKVRNYWGE